MKVKRDKKKRKKIVVIVFAVIGFLFCVGTIVGLTYAFYASDGGDGRIGVTITSGECEIDVVDEGDESLIGDVLDFVTAERKEKIYFEPGATYYTEGFRIKNIGTIPVNFRVYISEDEDADREAFEEAFELWITTDPANLEAAERLTEFTGRVGLDQTSETYYLVIRMRGNAGNEFQDGTYTGIGVTVFAYKIPLPLLPEGDGV